MPIHLLGKCCALESVFECRVTDMEIETGMAYGELWYLAVSYDIRRSRVGDLGTETWCECQRCKARRIVYEFFNAITEDALGEESSKARISEAAINQSIGWVWLIGDKFRLYSGVRLDHSCVADITHCKACFVLNISFVELHHIRPCSIRSYATIRSLRRTNAFTQPIP